MGDWKGQENSFDAESKNQGFYKHKTIKIIRVRNEREFALRCGGRGEKVILTVRRRHRLRGIRRCAQ